MLRSNDWEGVFRRPTDNIVIQFVRNPLAGIAAFAVDYLLLFVLTEIGIHYLLSAAIAFIAGTTVNYYLCRVLVFNAYIPRFRNMPEYLFFVIIGVIGLGLTELLMYLLTDCAGLHYLLSKIASGMLVSLWNFFGRRFFIFNQYETSEGEKRGPC
ncbi:MAG: GtrA family protein [Spirochaetes bacterium]|nr:GtrA family protein [Spirochaetota bacterium]